MTRSEHGRDLPASPFRLLLQGMRSRQQGSTSLKRFFRLASWSMIAFAFEKGALAAVMVLLAKILGATGYGRLALAQGMVNTAQIFVVLGAGTILARYIPAFLDESFGRAVEIINLCAMVILSTASLFVLVGIVGHEVIAADVLGLSAHSSVTYWIIGWVLLTAVNGLLFTIMLSLEEGRVIGIVSLVGAGALVIVAPLAAAWSGFYGAVIALATVTGLKALLLLRSYMRLLASRGVSPWASARRSDLPLLLSFGLPVFLSSALWAPTMWSAQIVLKQFSPTGLAEVGVFGFCNNILGLVILMSSVTNRAAFPILSSLKERGDSGETRKFVISILSIQIIAAVAMGAPLAAFAPEIMAAMGSEFADGVAALLVMVAAGICISGQQPLINLLLVNDMAFTNLVGMVIWSVSLLSIALSLIGMGALGVSFGVLCASIIRVIFIAAAIMLAQRRGGNVI